MFSSKGYLLIVSILIPVLLLLSKLLFHYSSYMLLSFIIIGCIIVPFFARFEIRKISGREIVIIAILTAIAAVGRVPFAGLPSVQPTSFVIIMAALVFGAESGFIIGAIAALVSNIFLGQGPWTPWQMFAWGMMGMSAGLFRHTWWMKKIWGMAVFGFIWGYLYGWMMNMWIIVSNIENFTWEFFTGVFVSSLFFDLAHGISNVVFILVFAKAWTKILERFKQKYGLLNKGS